MVFYLLKETTCSKSDMLGPREKNENNYNTIDRCTLHWDLQHLKEVFNS